MVNIYCNLKNVVDVTDSVKKGVPKKPKQIFWTWRLKFSCLSKWGNQICTKSQDFVVRSPIIWHLKSPKVAVFGCQRKGLRTPKSKNEDKFLSPAFPKSGGFDTCWHLFELDNTFRQVFGKFWKSLISDYFWADWPFWNPKIKTLWHHRLR